MKMEMEIEAKITAKLDLLLKMMDEQIKRMDEEAIWFIKCHCAEVKPHRSAREGGKEEASRQGGREPGRPLQLSSEAAGQPVVSSRRKRTKEAASESPGAGNAMARPAQQRQRQRRLAVLLLALLFSLSLAAAVSAANRYHGWKEGVEATALEEAVDGQEAAEGGRPERVEMEVINDYPQIGPNNRHNPHP
ncbi:hypothetical protein GUJ93_ZPchr0001g32398 [Zizania palustris]|uniref:Uncharacterized protein n=1 Tax=Zizania palustris TaxID=103762 RepID=A0A8J5REZ8_ZIZPA|nr:hypothetical protein GUJ93_ZPchr0001g32398 [Zizania palustris]